MGVINLDSVKHYPLIQVNVPDWYKREDFTEWINKATAPGERQRVATWHVHGDAPGEFSDVFVTYDQGEGSDFEGIPEDCWTEICDLCRRSNICYAVIWLTNLEEIQKHGQDQAAAEAV